ncbi:Uncharacterised protein [Candidatus Bilamarchaeum dharawalense]|uniref:Brix domain-containing protein n=1 Tax=Candidatus Bilamarchaeum dharawalense TaxID=2885759 RepID=A0A5E4LS76_9ARCH|nr:Uncharacterised protein [Candidatus Bilamarchaeum dharawalense]
MYTTSRYASTETRELAKKMAKEKEEPYTARGKKTIDQLVDFARRKGEENITVVEEHEKKPTTFALIQIDELGRWKWKRG